MKNTNVKAVLSSLLCCAAALGFSLPARERLYNIGNAFTLKDPKSCVYVPGAGFSGFFYTIGRLQGATAAARQTNDNVDYYCYSAGCLATVATLANITVFDVHDNALALQNQWKAGDISQYEVVELFIDYLISTGRQRSLDEKALANLHIITSEVSNSNRWFPKLSTTTRSPRSLEELRTMLRQTTWIPGGTGLGLAHKRHLDGAFTSAGHPSCPTSLDLPKWDWSWKSFEFYANILGVNMSREQVERFWRYGVDKGLQIA